MRFKFSTLLVLLFSIGAPVSAHAALFDDWNQVGPTGSWSASACSANCESSVAAQSPGEIWVSTDMGSTWIQRTSATNRSWTGVAMSGSGQTIYAAASGNNIYKSIDSGASWTTLTSAGTAFWTDVATSSDGAVVIASVSGGSVFTSIDGGANWTQQTSITTAAGWRAVDITPSGTTVVAANNAGQLWRGTGTIGSWTWTNISAGKITTNTSTTVSNQQWRGLTMDDSGTRFALVSNEIFFSGDSGGSWLKLTAGNSSYSGISGTSDMKLFIASNSVACTFCRPVTYETSNYTTFTSRYAANALQTGNAAITVAKDGSRAISPSTSSYIYQSGSIAYASTTSLSISGSPVFRLPTTITANLTPTSGGRVTFFANGKKIGGCIALPASSGSQNCTWRPSTRGVVRLMARFTPSDTSATSSTSAMLETRVLTRATKR